MKTILVDDELLAMEQFESECRELEEIELVGKFDNAEDALRYAREHEVEFALMDICLPGMDGIELGKKLKEINPDIILIYVTGYSKYVVDTMKIKADYCIMKPYDKADIEDAIIRAKLLSKRFRKKVKIVTYGRFDVYLEEEPLYFGNEKARELMAYCVGRCGANVTMEEAIDILWPDRPYDDRVKRLYRKAVGVLQAKLSDVFISNRGSCHIDREKVDCDLYQVMEEELNPEDKAHLKELGCLTEYSWSEYLKL